MKAKRKHKISKNPKPSSRAAVPTDVLRILRDYPHQSYSVLRQAFPAQLRDSYMLGQGNGACRSGEPQYSLKKYKVIDLFAGAGGFTLGFMQTGRFEPIFANDFNVYAAKTYNANFGDHCLHGDIMEFLQRKSWEIPQADVIIGGPPCQGFSLLNKQRHGDPRKELWKTFLEVVERVLPSVFVMENVPELLASLEFLEIKKTAERLGYCLVSGVLNAADYGVPQRRKRAIVIASRRGQPELPKPTHFDSRKARNLYQQGFLDWETVGRAIGDLPGAEGIDIKLGLVPPPMDLHFGRSPTKESLQRYKCIPEGGNRFDLQKNRPDITPDCWIRKKSGGTDLFGRLWWDRPAFTIRTEFFKPEKGRYLHPRQHRPITHREAARLQSFPDNFLFVGTKIEVARQIGNAVPPLLAKNVAKAVLDHFLETSVC